MKTNFHTHHELCGHARGTAEDYVKEALRHDFRELGFSDHAPNDDMGLGFRMADDEFDVYLADIEEMQRKYHNRLTIYKGLEIEHWYHDPSYYDRFLNRVDYLILGQHHTSIDKSDTDLISSFALTTPDQIKAYGRTICDGMRTGRYDIVAHPELYLNSYLVFDETAEAVAHLICSCAEQTGVILEYNANGYRKASDPNARPYPRPEFWAIVEQYDIRTILSSDCHTPEQLHDDTIDIAEEAYLRWNTTRIESYASIKNNPKNG